MAKIYVYIFFLTELLQLIAIELKLEKFLQLLYKLHFFPFPIERASVPERMFWITVFFFPSTADRLAKYFDIINSYTSSVTSWIITVTATVVIFMAFITASSMMQKRNILFSIDSTVHNNKILFYYSRSPEIAGQVCDRQEGKLHLLKSQHKY